MPCAFFPRFLLLVRSCGEQGQCAWPEAPSIYAKTFPSQVNQSAYCRNEPSERRRQDGKRSKQTAAAPLHGPLRKVHVNSTASPCIRSLGLLRNTGPNPCLSGFFLALGLGFSGCLEPSSGHRLLALVRDYLVFGSTLGC